MFFQNGKSRYEVEVEVDCILAEHGLKDLLDKFDVDLDRSADRHFRKISHIHRFMKTNDLMMSRLEVRTKLLRKVSKEQERHPSSRYRDFFQEISDGIDTLFCR